MWTVKSNHLSEVKEIRVTLSMEVRLGELYNFLEGPTAIGDMHSPRSSPDQMREKPGVHNQSPELVLISRIP